MTSVLSRQSNLGRNDPDAEHLVVHCSSCRSAHELARPGDPGSANFCGDCLDDVAAIEFPEFYRDLGVGD